jgi:hypothetical protein
LHTVGRRVSLKPERSVHLEPVYQVSTFLYLEAFRPSASISSRVLDGSHQITRLLTSHGRPCSALRASAQSPHPSGSFHPCPDCHTSLPHTSSHLMPTQVPRASRECDPGPADPAEACLCAQHELHLLLLEHRPGERDSASLSSSMRLHLSSPLTLWCRSWSRSSPLAAFRPVTRFMISTSFYSPQMPPVTAIFRTLSARTPSASEWRGDRGSS